MDISAAWVRALRAALFTALCVTLSAGSHVLLSGRPLPLLTVGAAAAAVFALAYSLAGRERGYGRIAALLVPLELGATALFTTGQDTCYGRPGHPASAPGALAWLCSGSTGGPLARLASPGSAPWLLFAGHVAVGLLAAAWLRRGERALAGLLCAAAAAVCRPLRLRSATGAPPAGGVTVRFVRAARPGRALPLLVHSVVRRGPPPGPAFGRTPA
ncbi:hypothetical protein GO001_16735 [Streptomyces sp. NRRL B-1677]|uniref:Integral membrane protein n=1 Tax=Streptomyces klenkii TaxID=1420899 RepID=A0A3B0BR87_9ACTN|nr:MULTISPECIES: hypothetical protein [Streptomyces]MBF6046860.1 hypothetical protein [Streptomyces sp. NRRL B-1677]RKN75340.1 hypothetical protein D7231_07805 [Streptomyces klenkii]